jgi:hypothetical protein
MANIKPRFKVAVLVSDLGLEATAVTSGDQGFGARAIAEAEADIQVFADRFSTKARLLRGTDEPPEAPRGRVA